jgi:hypothetical protein
LRKALEHIKLEMNKKMREGKRKRREGKCESETIQEMNF